MLLTCSKTGTNSRAGKQQDVNALAIALDNVIATHLQLGYSVIVRDDDYKSIYGAAPTLGAYRKIQSTVFAFVRV